MAGEAQKEYQWRETYYILFPSSRRPTVTQVEHTLSALSDRIALENLTANDEDRFETVMVQSPDDYAALEITFESGQAVVEQAVDLAKQLKSEAESEQLALLMRADARLDVMHFEQVVSEVLADDEEPEEMLDPSCLLMVVDALVELTGGIAVDPASGTILP